MGEKVHAYYGPALPQDKQNPNYLSFYCPGCEYEHAFRVADITNLDTNEKLPRWTWNGSYTRPTFEPSLLVFGSIPEKRCHSFVREGRIIFLNDCFHKLAGQTVELPDYEN